MTLRMARHGENAMCADATLFGISRHLHEVMRLRGVVGIECPIFNQPRVGLDFGHRERRATEVIVDPENSVLEPDKCS